MSIVTASDWKLSIGTTAAASNQSEYEADSYVEIGEIESLGEFGDESADVTFTSLGAGRVRHLKGPRDSGVLALTVGRDPLDTGQAALDAAEQTSYDYNIKVEASDALNAGYTDSVFYFRAKIMSRRINAGAADNVVRINYNIGLQTAITEVASAVIP